ncbi:hypothetical protein Ptr902_13441 (mitochondrion) [Pyrenophora tritici-repentis]|nr:hypothetical protein Ptr902_13441 [Pyrenophora tritici-repentis]
MKSIKSTSVIGKRLSVRIAYFFQIYISIPIILKGKTDNLNANGY